MDRDAETDRDEKRKPDRDNRDKKDERDKSSQVETVSSSIPISLRCRRKIHAVGERAASPLSDTPMKRAKTYLRNSIRENDVRYSV